MTAPEQPASVVAYIGLGSNLANPRAQVRRAMDELAALPGCTLCLRSSLYATPPLGPVAQPEFVNAVVSLATTLTPLELLAALQGLEREHGRVRDGTRWGPRTLDLDLLIFDELQLQLPGLIVPHPELAKRSFVLVPLAEIAPVRLLIPGHGRLQDLLAALPDRDAPRRLPETAAAAAAVPGPQAPA